MFRIPFLLSVGGIAHKWEKRGGGERHVTTNESEIGNSKYVAFFSFLGMSKGIPRRNDEPATRFFMVKTCSKDFLGFLDKCFRCYGGGFERPTIR